MEKALSDDCIYTILHPNLLKEKHELGGPATFSESKPWVTGRLLWQQAQKRGEQIAVLLGDATDCSRLLYWGLLTAVEITNTGTRFSVEGVRRLPKRHRPQELVLRSSGNHIAPNFIRPYALCRTPDFLHAAMPELNTAPGRGPR